MLMNHWLSFFQRPTTRRSKVARGTNRTRQLCVQSLEPRIVLADTWTGAKDTNWNNPLNWTGGVPVTGTNVLLTFGAQNQGITNVTSVELGSLQIDDPAYSLAEAAAGVTLGFNTLTITGAFNFTFNMNVEIDTQGSQNASINLPGNQLTTLTITGVTFTDGNNPNLTINNLQDTVLFNGGFSGTFGTITNTTNGLAGKITIGPVLNTSSVNVHSTGKQQWASALTLTAQTTTFTSDTSDLDFFYSMDGGTQLFLEAPTGTVELGAGNNPTLFKGGLPTGKSISDAIGATTALASLQVDSTNLDMNFAEDATGATASIRTSTDQRYNATTVMGQNTVNSGLGFLANAQRTIQLSARDVTFNGTLDGEHAVSADDVHTAQLVVNTNATLNPDGTVGLTLFKGQIGALNPLLSMTLNPNNPGVVANPILGLTEIQTNVVNTYGFQTYNAPLMLNAPLIAGVRTVTMSTRDDGGNLAVGIGNDITFNGSVDSAFDPVTGNSAGTPNNLVLNINEQITATANVNFGDGINDDYVGNKAVLQSLVITPAGLTAQGNTNIEMFEPNQASIETIDQQTYGMSVVIRSAAVLQSTDANQKGNIVFKQFVDAGSSAAAGNSPQTLVVSTDATTEFDQEVGSLFPLLHLTTEGTGGTITSGDPTVGTTLFKIAPDLNITGGLVNASVTTSGGMSFFNAVQLNKNTTFFSNLTPGGIDSTNTTSGNIQFLNTIDTAPGAGAAASLDINTLGTTQFGSGLTLYPNHVVPLSQGIGFASPLASVMVNDSPGYGLAANGANSILTAQGQTLIQYNLSADPNNPSITTTGNMKFYNPVVLGLNTVLKSTAGGDILFASQVNSQSSATPSALTVNTGAGAGSVTFGFTTVTTSNTGSEQVGNVHPLQSLSITSAKTALDVHASTDAAPTIATLTDQTYNTHTFVGQNAVLTSRQTGNVAFNGMIDALNGNPQSLIVNSLGNELFTQAIGTNAILSALTTDDDKTVGIGGAAIFTAGSAGGTPTVKTTGNQTFNDNVILGANSIFTTVASGNVVFANTINSQSAATPSSLTVNSAGNTDFGTGQNGSNIGTKVPLLSVTTDAPGFTRFNVPGSTNTNPTVQTVGSQTYNDPVILLNNTVLSSTTNAPITVASTRGAPPFVLTINPNPTAVNALAGFYTVNTPNAPTPGPIAQVIQDGNNLTFIDPNNTVTQGSVKSPTVIDGRNGLTGILTTDRIAWSDGTYWNKIDLSGSYTINNHPTPVGQITQVGTALTFVNPFNVNQTTTGTQTAFNAVVDSGNGVNGQVVFNANGSINEIVFANGDVWVRQANGVSANAPVVTLPTGPISYTPNTGAVILDPNATVTDPDSLNFNAGNLTVVVAQNGTASDVLGIRNVGNGSGQISVGGNNVFYGGTLIGTITGSGNGASTPLVVTFNNNATPAATQALLRDITFATTDGTSVAPRTIQATVTDDTGLISTPANMVVNVGASQPPVITVSGGTTSYTLNNPAQIIDSNIQVTDVDSPTFNNGTVTVSLVGGGTVNDVLSIRNQGTLLGQIGVAGNTVSYSGTAIGTFTGGTNLQPLVFTLNQFATPAAVQALLRNVTFNTVGPNATAGLRTVQFQMTDGMGGTSIPVSDGVNVVPLSGNQPPVITLPSGPATYVHNKKAIVVDPLALLTDVSLTSFPGGTLHVQIAGAAKQDFLGIKSVGNKPGQISVLNGHVKYGGVTFATISGTAKNHVFTFNANASQAAVQALLRSITFHTQGFKVPLGARQVQFQMGDGLGNVSTLVSTQVNVI